MDTAKLPPDFKEFLSLLNSNHVEYLLIGGYAVGFHGYPRATADMDVWIAINPENIGHTISALHQFGMNDPSLNPDVFKQENFVLRMGVPPIRIELLTGIDGVGFADCYQRRLLAVIDGMELPLISKADLIKNKEASGRHKDIDDLEHLR